MSLSRGRYMRQGTAPRCCVGSRVRYADMQREAAANTPI